MKEIEHLIALIPNKTCSLDPIPTWLLKQCSSQLAPIILNIVNRSLATSQVPQNLKSAVVRPLLKKPNADPECMKNYRPVSNLPTVEKILEQVISKRLEEHIQSENLHDSMQSAYRKHHSTETALMKMHCDITQALDQGSHVALLTLDLSAAFDTVDHLILLTRLENLFGITGDALEWMSSYFQDRSQSVLVGTASSGKHSLNSGVPQGSVLGPKCYSLYTKPIGCIIRRHGLQYITYADDNNVYIVIKPFTPWDTTASLLQSCLQDVQIWMSANMLKLNMDKTELIVFTPKSHARSLQVGDCVVGESDVIVSLGAHCDKHFTMEKQVNATVKSCYYNIGNIGKIRGYIDEDACKTLVRALVTSRLDYANSLYVGLPQFLLHHLQLVQNTAARLITRTPRRDHIKPVLYQLHWLPIEQRVKYKLLLYAFKAVNGIAPVYIQDMFQVHTPGRSLRSSTQLLLQVPKTKTVTYGEKSIRAVTAKLWNNLPSSLVASISVNTFKSSLKTLLFRDYFY